MSAYGLSLADVVHKVQRPAAIVYSPQSRPSISEQLEALAAEASSELIHQGFSIDKVSCDYFLNMRYSGSNNSIMTLQKDIDADFLSNFEKTHQLEFGFCFKDKPVVVDDIRVRAVGVAHSKVDKSPLTQLKAVDPSAVPPKPSSRNQVYFSNDG